MSGTNTNSSGPHDGRPTDLGGLQSKGGSLILSWNINGFPCKQGNKLSQLRSIILSNRPTFVCLQETHTSRETEYRVRKELPRYVWYFSHGSSAWGGVATGVRRTVLRAPSAGPPPECSSPLSLPLSATPSPLPGPALAVYATLPGRVLIIRMRIAGDNVFVINVYAHVNNSARTATNIPVPPTMTPTTFLVGDFNQDFARDGMGAWENVFNEWRVSDLPLPATYHTGSCIDHVAVPLDDDEEFITTVIPTTLRDHYPILAARRIVAERVELAPRTVPRRERGPACMPVWAFRNAAFLHDLTTTLNNIPQRKNPFRELRSLHNEARRIVTKWTAKNKTSRESCDVRDLLWWVHVYASPADDPRNAFDAGLTRSRIQPPPERPADTDPPSVWRKALKALGKLNILSLSHTTGTDISHLGFDTSRPRWQRALRRKHNSMGGVMVGNTLSQDPNDIAEAIQAYWSQIFQEPAFDSNAVQELAEAHPATLEPLDPPEQDAFLASLRGLDTASAPGPDGVPYIFYVCTWGRTGKVLYRILVELMKRGPRSLPDDFNASLGYFIPKVPNASHPSDTRPIAVANTSYRLIMRFVAKMVRPLLPDVAHPAQAGLVPGRSINDAIDAVTGQWYQRVVNAEDSYLLQLDFSKAFDRLARPAMATLLRALGLPEWLLNVVSNSWSNTYVTTTVRGAKPLTIPVAGGVKQGCPMSPLIYILTIDHLLQAIAK
jgi:Reverse transcriptase (RNA-dependent DNA polymerase)/Endonuclease/Exonuclease/phosphatase family